MQNEEKRTKSELLIHLINNNEHGRSVSELVEQAKRAYYELHDEYPELEDLSDGPYSKVTLDDAIEKLLFELKNDQTLMLSLRQPMTTVLYDRLMKTVKSDAHSKEQRQMELLRLADDLSQEVIALLLDLFTLRTENKKKSK